MRELFSLIFDIATDPLGLPIPAIWEYIILDVVGIVAFKIAFEVSPGGFGGSAIHWGIRLIAFVGIWAVLYGVITVGKFIIAHWVLIVCGLATVAVVGIIAAILWQRRSSHTTTRYNP